MADFWDTEELIGKFVKNSREEIQIKKVSKNNKSYIDIRVFWYDSKSDEFRPSQKGVAIPLEFVSELKSLLDTIDY
ncbi:MAG TPA: transcriptional coactivator p15 [Clostridiaceae bacterium]|nr:transcriptional coactivator p15 [Clostridiaceae bacterium]